MTYTASSFILGAGKSTPAQIDRYFEIMGRSLAPRYAPDKLYQPAPSGLGQMIIEAARLWPQSVNHDLLAAQCLKESAAWQSEYARHRFNPSGLGAINNQPDNAIRFPTPAAGLRATVAHLLTYIVGPGAWTEYDPRASVTPPQNQGAANRLSDLDGRWAVPGVGYGAGIAKLANELLEVEASNMPPATRLIDMFDHVPTIDTSQVMTAKQIADGPNFPHRHLDALTGLTFHQTGNPKEGANAQAHRDFVANGGGAKPGYEGVSYQWTVDDKSIIQITPIDTACWHAGNTTGNMTTNALEMCINSDGDYYRTLYNAAYWGAWMQREHGIAMTDKRQHNAWSGKNCPRQIRERGEWGWFLQGIEDWRAVLDTPTETERIINGYVVRGAILSAYRQLEIDGEHWWTLGVPVADEIPGVLVDGVERTVQEFDRAPWIITEGDGVVIAKPDQIRQIHESLGIDDNGNAARLDRARDLVRDALDELNVLAGNA